MNIYEFINSNDIREFLEKQNYEFDPLQKAYLIWQSGRHTLAQKHEAWQEIINTLPDMEVPERAHCEGFESLHKMLADYMATEKKYLKLFEKKEPENAFLSAQLYEKRSFIMYTSDEYEWVDTGMRSADLSKVYDNALEYSESEAGAKRFRIFKNFYTDTDREARIVTEYDKNGNMMEVWWDLPGEDNKDMPAEVPRHSKYEYDLSFFFFGLWYDIPVPFKKGDIVHAYDSDMPFLLMGTVPWYKRKRQERKEYYDESDMRAYGYCCDNKTGFLYDDYDCNYLDLEYYKKELKGSENLLKYYSIYEKEKDCERANVDAWWLMRLARLYLLRDMTEREEKETKYFFEQMEYIEKHKKNS